MRLFIGIIVLFTIIGSCSSSETTNYEVGSDFLESNANIRVIDTFSINTGTFKVDNLITSGIGRILLGKIQDDNLGSLSSNSYFQLSTSNFTIDDNAEYDSIGFVMNYDKYYYGDTLVDQTYKLYRVTETFEPEDDEDSFYNNASLDFDNTNLLGELTFTPRPNRGDSLYMPVTDLLGEEIFNKIKDNEINSSDDFILEYKGFTIFPDTTTVNHSNVIGFNTSTIEYTTNNTSLRVYYTVEDGDNEDDGSFIDIVLTDNTNLFNHINSDYVNDKLSDSEETLNSSETNDQFFIQGGSGISGKITIPGIKKLNDAYEYGTTLDAELTFKPANSSYDNVDDLQDSLLVYIVDSKNRIISQLFDSDLVTPHYALLNEDISDLKNYYYSVNMSSYIETILASESDLDYNLMIQFSDFDSAVENTVIEAGDRNENSVKLSVKYLNY